MIASKKGREMLLTLSTIYEQSIIMQSLYEAIGSEFDNLELLNKEIELQLFPQSATWGLSFWENRVGLATNLDEAIETRRRKVIAKLQSKYIMTPKRMSMILQSYTGANIKINENISPYTFGVELTSTQGFPRDLEDLYKRVNVIKPSHLSVSYKLVSLLKSKTYFAQTTIMSEEITVYPYSSKEVKANVKAKFALAHNMSSEILTVYPKGGGING
ncbi:YmfQ family protein [Clostridioides sp. ES-S-0005-03]|uniref:YmfQ family protein n=1 Tax=Clostridioides sp. ES-S-0005-03 TaxID=2770774 RepID=UPI001D101404|nr:YmfQ family protein [Clostridioides sp. ES-S-0005-03]UDN46639.1 YmfQ family protein [Clostridioides sp. ES-S-0173-01]